MALRQKVIEYVMAESEAFSPYSKLCDRWAGGRLFHSVSPAGCVGDNNLLFAIYLGLWRKQTYRRNETTMHTTDYSYFYFTFLKYLFKQKL